MRKRSGIVRVLLRLICAGCAAYVIWYMTAGAVRGLKDRQLAEQIRQAQAETEAGSAGPDGLPEAAGSEGESRTVSVSGDHVPVDTGAPEILPEYAKLYGQNTDLAGWLSVEGTGIDYPVMRSEDDAFYLSHDFQGEEDRYGCLFIRSRVDIANPGDNVIVYGHNMKDGAMFGELDRYMDETFYRDHPVIRFDTLYAKGSYEIIGAFRAKVLEEGEEGFRYYDFYEAETQEEFEEFYSSVKDLSLYETEAEAVYGDRLLTLSTCSYHTGEGRFVVVARKEAEWSGQ